MMYRHDELSQLLIKRVVVDVVKYKDMLSNMHITLLKQSDAYMHQ